jgi:hypothetical protein
MFKNQMVQLIIDLQKKGVHIHLTDEGYREFLKLMQEGLNEEIAVKNAG